MKRSRRPAERERMEAVGRVMVNLTWESVALIHKCVGKVLPEWALKADVLRTMEAHQVVRGGVKGMAPPEFAAMMKAVFRRGIAMIEELEAGKRAEWAANLADPERN